MIVTCYQGKNDTLISNVITLYASNGDIIADVTYGKGAFWKSTDMSKYEFLPTDLSTGVDFRNLPYQSKSIDILVLDPPYMHGSGTIHKNINAVYNNNHSVIFKSHADVIKLYAAGIKEAHRVLKTKGYLWVKCQDEIESGKQNWSHIELFNIARDVGYYAKDLFVLAQDTIPMLQQKEQRHARKNHSYLWIFQKT